MPDFTDMLQNANRAFADKDLRKGLILLLQILKTDFTFQPAWVLLHRVMGGDKPFLEFQNEFARKYFPEKVHLLPNQGQKNPEPVIPQRTADIPAPSQPGDNVAPHPTPVPVKIKQSSALCGQCGNPLLVGGGFCPSCGRPVPAEQDNPIISKSISYSGIHSCPIPPPIKKAPPGKDAIPEWVLEKLREASITLENGDQYAFHQIINRYGRDFINYLARYRRNCRPGTKDFFMVDNVLRQILNAPTDKEVMDVESRSKKSLIGLIVGGLFGIVVGISSDSILSLVGCLLLYGFLGWTCAWVWIGPGSPLAKSLIFIYPIVGLYKAIEHKNNLKSVKALRQDYFNRLRELERARII